MQKRSKRLCLALAVLLSVSMVLVALVPAVEAASYKKGLQRRRSHADPDEAQKLGLLYRYRGRCLRQRHRARCARLPAEKRPHGRRQGRRPDAGGHGPVCVSGGNSGNSGGSGGASSSQVDLLARLISAEARGEPYSGQVAVGAVVLNRIKHPSFRTRSPVSSIRAGPLRASAMDSSISRSRRVPTVPRAMHSTGWTRPAARSIISIRPQPPARGSGRGHSSRLSVSTGSAPECPERAQNRGCGSVSPLHIAG